MLANKDTNIAIQLFKEIINTDSGYFEAYSPLSKIYFNQDRLKKAVDLNKILISVCKKTLYALVINTILLITLLKFAAKKSIYIVKMFIFTPITK